MLGSSCLTRRSKWLSSAVSILLAGYDQSCLAPALVRGIPIVNDGVIPGPACVLVHANARHRSVIALHHLTMAIRTCPTINAFSTRFLPRRVLQDIRVVVVAPSKPESMNELALGRTPRRTRIGHIRAIIAPLKARQTLTCAVIIIGVEDLAGEKAFLRVHVVGRREI